MAARSRSPAALTAARGRSGPTPAPRRTWAWAAPAAVGLAALLAYANSLRNGFVWDDPIILSRQLVVFRSVGDVLAPPRDIPQFSPDYYRPLTIATYLIDRAAGGGDPFAFHFSVVVAHAATSVLVYLVALQLLTDSLPGGHLGPRGRAREGAGDEREQRAATIGAFAAGALFALHPIHTESVAWAAGRSDVLATGFLLAALIVHGRPVRSWAGSVLAGLCALAALGAKETAIALYPLMFLRDVLSTPARRRTVDAWLRGWAGPLLALAVYGLLRRHALGEVMGSAAEALPVGQRSPLELIGAVGMYVERLLWPVRLNAYIDHIDTGPITIALAALLLAGIGAALWHWSRVQGVEGSRVDGLGHTDRNPGTLEPSNPSVPLFALSWLLLTLIPSLAILWKIPDAPLAERYLYLPSVGFCLLVGHGVARLWSAGSARSTRVAIAAGMGAVLLTAGIGTVRRNGVWYDDIALWEDTERKSQVSGMAARSLGTAYQQRGRPADARAAFGRALQRVNTSRGRETIYNNLGTLAMYDGDYAAAQRNYESALAANPNGPDTMFNLGLAILHRGGRSREAAQAALVHYQRAQQINPHDSDIEAALAEAYDILGQPAAAGQHARRALELGAQGQTAESLRALLERTQR